MDDVLVLRARPPLDRDEIRRVAPLLARHGATRAFLLGSYARGEADAWSDVDLVVGMPTARPFVERPFDLADVLDAIPVDVDLLVYTPKEFAAGVRRNRGVFHIVSTEGVALL